MRRFFIFLNCAVLAVASIVLIPAFALADVPASYNSYGYASGVHEIAGSDAFPNFQNGAVNNRYPLAQVQQDASPSTTAVGTYSDSGPLGATAGSQYNQGCANGSSSPPPSQICENPNNKVPYATATYPGGPSHAHIDGCNGCGQPPRADSDAAQMNASSSAVYAGGGQPFNGAAGQTSTVMDQGGTLTVVTHSEVDSFHVGDVNISKVVVDLNGHSSVSGADGSASVTGGNVTAGGHPVSVTDQGVTVESKQPVPCPQPPAKLPVPVPAPPQPPPPPAPVPIPGLPGGPVGGGGSGGSGGSTGGQPGTTGCVPAFDVTYIKMWTVAPSKTTDGSHLVLWATGMHVLVTHPSTGPGVPTQSTEYILGEGFMDLQAGNGGAFGGAFGFGDFGFGGGFGSGDFGGFGDQTGSPGSAAQQIGTFLAANRVPLAWLFFTVEALLLASAAAWVWSRNTAVDKVPDEVLSP
ncbi:MAG TPA: hypothetical protein VNA65_06215 [Candidatus Dormibacteraeota bacterium]|nr:hypothetical protein [Candidatus Dormibacteraeota bacterium]